MDSLLNYQNICTVYIKAILKFDSSKSYDHHYCKTLRWGVLLNEKNLWKVHCCLESLFLHVGSTEDLEILMFTTFSEHGHAETSEVKMAGCLVS